MHSGGASSRPTYIYPTIPELHNNLMEEEKNREWEKKDHFSANVLPLVNCPDIYQILEVMDAFYATLRKKGTVCLF